MNNVEIVSWNMGSNVTMAIKQDVREIVFRT
jgi:hypothetical protein